MQQLVPIEGEKDVQPVDQFPIYELGGALAQLRVAANAVARSTTETGKDRLGTLYWADYHMSRLLDGTTFQILFSRSSAQTVRTRIAQLIAITSEGASYRPRRQRADVGFSRRCSVEVVVSFAGR